ncbi:hypothetical protein GALMADRAFT_139714 [Galerina marginata CBS 339.88]|uniref:Major facilitator superfamily (MFS) profile domain-containing protein n=1 Tax=Galerina marginata (strain CBS 339.88) TaxID=685588 RepID=A0A067T0X6_GALM3|nr:hypothetical protein GALMADRAFT_139714 [Galerina marginata CBS 339.88]
MAGVAETKTEEKRAPAVVKQTPTFPEGGFQAWGTVLGAFLVQVCQFGYTSSFGVYQDFYVREYITNSTPSAISWIGSFNAFLMISGGVISGRLYDKGHFYSLLWGGSLLTVFSLFMLSLARPDHYYQVFLTQGLGLGLGGGICYVPSVAIVSHYFQRRRTLAMTIVASGASLGAVIHPIMLNHILGKRLGFGNSVRASAGLVGGLLLIACSLMRTRLPPKESHVNSRKVLSSLVHDAPYIAATFGLLVFSIGFYFPQFYLQLDATSHHLNSTFSFYSLVLLNVSSALGRLVPGALANTFGVANMIVIATFSGSAAIFGMAGVSSIAGVVLVGIIYGFFAGSFVGLTAPLFATLTPDLSELGIRMGVAFFFSGIGTLIGEVCNRTPISGALLTDKFVWWRPAVFSGIMAFLGSISFMIMVILLRSRASKAKVTPDPVVKESGSPS